MICYLLTTLVKGYPFEVPIAVNAPGVVLADQIKSLDWRMRSARHKGRVSARELASVRAKIKILIGC